MPSQFNVLNLVLGQKCNYRCQHCINYSGPNHSGGDRLNYEAVLEAFKRVKPQEILFTGGEPTLHMQTIVNVKQMLEEESKDWVPIYKMTSNGWFGATVRQAKKVLSKINFLSELQVSFDFFHGSLSTPETINNIQLVCNELKINVSIVTAVSNLNDVAILEKIFLKTGLKILPQPVAPLGRAKENNLGFRRLYFDKKVLSKKCPNAKVLTYIVGKGFTNCCSSIAFDGRKGILFNSIHEYIQSSFKSKTTEMTLGERANTVQYTKFDPEDSHPCVLCEKILRRECV